MLCTFGLVAHLVSLGCCSCVPFDSVAEFPAHADDDSEDSTSSEEDDIEHGSHTDHSDDSMHTSDFETSHDSLDDSSDGEAVQHPDNQGAAAD